MELLNSMPKSERVLSLNEDLKKALKDLQKEIEESNFLINEESHARNFRYLLYCLVHAFVILMRLDSKFYLIPYQIMTLHIYQYILLQISY